LPHARPCRVCVAPLINPVVVVAQGKAAQGRRSVLCGTLFSCIDHLVAEGQAKPKPAPATPAAKAHQALSAKAASSKLHGEGEASTVKDAEKTIEGAAAVATAVVEGKARDLDFYTFGGEAKDSFVPGDVVDPTPGSVQDDEPEEHQRKSLYNAYG